jgi:hypothetical protein
MSRERRVKDRESQKERDREGESREQRAEM